MTGRKSDRILPLFEQMSSLPREPVPYAQRDARLARVWNLPRGSLFATFDEEHLKEANDLFEILYSCVDFDDFIELATQARAVVNEGLFIYALFIAVLHRDDCKGCTPPPIQEVFPDKFIPAETIVAARKEAEKSNDVTVKIDKTGRMLNPEYKLAYFREDIGINSHHWTWHVVNPFYWNEELTGKIKDRKGELFYYMHHQMLARYDCERLANGLKRVLPLHNFSEKLESYAPHLTALRNGKHYGPRPKGHTLQDLPDTNVQDLQKWKHRILEAIDLRSVHAADGSHIPLDEKNGTNIVGALVEASTASPNRDYYGNLHNRGHIMLSKVHDPDDSLLEEYGAMSDTTTAVRDSIFFRWHKFVDDVVEEHKATLKPYTIEELSFEGVNITEIKLNTEIPNVITTYFKDAYLDLTHAINFGPGHEVKVKYHHLDYKPVSFIINVENNTGSAKHATFRVFLGPKYDEDGNRYTLDGKRKLMIELDKFHKELAPGKNVIERNAADSSVTNPHTHTFNELKDGETEKEADMYYCICGWPQYMLFPRGTLKGMEFELFVMCTDYTVDNPEGIDVNAICSGAAISFCGAKDQKYPDTKAMGFPFDRRIEDPFTELQIQNMAIANVTVKFMA